DSPKVLPVRKHFGLMGQIGAAAVHEVYARQPVLSRNFLRAQMLLHSHGKIGTTLDRGVVAHDYALSALDPANSRNQSRAVDCFVVHPVRSKWRQFEKRRTRIDQ